MTLKAIFFNKSNFFPFGFSEKNTATKDGCEYFSLIGEIMDTFISFN